MTAFGKQPDRSARELVEEAVACALRDAELEAADVQAAFVGNAAGGVLTGQESMRGQTVLRRTGLLGAPIVNVENADASGSTAPRARPDAEPGSGGSGTGNPRAAGHPIRRPRRTPSR